jgi:hypothetical protein
MMSCLMRGRSPRRDHEMMLLVVHTQRHDAKETKPLEFWQIGRVTHGDGHHRALGVIFGHDGHAVGAAHRLGMSRDHTADGLANGAGPGHSKTHAVFNRIGGCLSIERHVVHVDEVPPQTGDIDL